MIDRHQVERIAHLARIEVPESRRDALAAEMQRIVGYVDQIAALDTSGVPPMTHAGAGANVYRDDVPGQSLTVDEALAVAADREGPYYRVPRVVGEA